MDSAFERRASSSIRRPLIIVSICWVVNFILSITNDRFIGDVCKKKDEVIVTARRRSDFTINYFPLGATVHTFGNCKSSKFHMDSVNKANDLLNRINARKELVKQLESIHLSSTSCSIISRKFSEIGYRNLGMNISQSLARNLTSQFQ